MNTHECIVQPQKEKIARTHTFPFPVASPSPNELATGLHFELTILLLSSTVLHYVYMSLTDLDLFFFCTLYKWTPIAYIFWWLALFTQHCFEFMLKAVLLSFLYSISLYKWTLDWTCSLSPLFFCYKQSCYLFPGIHVQEFLQVIET